jgi:hypothetical protein
MIKLQNPSTKLQRKSKLQTPTQFTSAVGLELGIWSFSGAWCLDFGASLALGAFQP